MTTRQVRGAIVAGLLTCGFVGVAPALARAQDAALPEEGGTITLVGCFQHVKAHSKLNPEREQFVLMQAKAGTATSVPDEACSFERDAQTVELKDVHQSKLSRWSPGRWMEITGRLERMDGSDPRELHVKSYRAVPIAAPRAAKAVTAPLAQGEIVVGPIEQPQAPPVIASVEVGTSGFRTELPDTASSLPSVGLIGLMALAGALTIRTARNLLTRT